MNINEQKYWKEIYTKQTIPIQHSEFALFIYNYFKDKIFNVLDCGCGNGRDSYYLSLYNKVHGIDTSNKPEDKENCTFEIADFCNYDKRDYNLIYSRFTFHSITNEQQEEFLNSINNNSYLCIETRSDKSYNINKVYGDTHYRNYTNIDYLKKILNKYNFNIIYIDENNGYAKYKNEDPICIRLISKKIL